MHPGMTWSSTSAFSIAIPDLAYYLTRRTRTSQVDGWGSLITPYGTFQTLRIKSLLSLHDSVYIDSLGTGFPLNRNITEYKWLAKGYGVPILQINEEAGIAVATYRDFLRKPQGIAGTSVETLNLYPNPTNGIISLNIPALDHPVVMKISSSLGGLLKEFPIDNPDQKNIFDFSDLSDGLYFLQIADEGKIWVGKILILHY